MRRSALLRALPLLALPLVVLPGCRMNERMTGTIGGAVGGGLLGAAVGASAGGVVLAMAGGAIVGYVVGDYLSDQRERCGCAPPPCGGCSVPSPCEVYPGSFTQTERTAAAPSAPTPAASVSAAAARDAYERGRTATTAEEATAAYKESIRLDPQRPEPWNALALHALVAGDRTTARAHLTTALALDPAYGPARHNLERLDRGL
jgi:hypothetical protein